MKQEPFETALAEIAARADAATPGPWEAEVTPDETFLGTYSGRRSHPYDGDLPLVDHKLMSRSRKWPHNRAKGQTGATLEDFEFVSKAREDVPRLARFARALAERLIDAGEVDGALGGVEFCVYEIQKMWDESRNH
ncbi:MAG: hypothetical protein GTN75_00135 [Gemmatimonadetes bacterium]|nr:hypothetical protein [Gemmatimonadota bacterium]